MRYLILKKKSDEINQELIAGIRRMDPEAEFTESLEYCDIVVLAKGWARSLAAARQWQKAQELKKLCQDDHIYLTKETVHVN